MPKINIQTEFMQLLHSAMSNKMFLLMISVMFAGSTALLTGSTTSPHGCFWPSRLSGIREYCRLEVFGFNNILFIKFNISTSIYNVNVFQDLAVSLELISAIS